MPTSKPTPKPAPKTSAQPITAATATSGSKSFSRPEMKADETYTFFLVCAPGLEDVTVRELKNWFSDVEAKAEAGGVTVTATLEVGFMLNRVMKTPTRVLLRLFDFGCRDFPKLYKKILSFPWENWLGPDARAEFNASTHQSWLKIKKRIEETSLEAFEKHFEKLRKKPGHTHEIFVRFDKDICTVSLDTSGELLHKRSYRTHSSEAPLRETLAASLLLLLDQVAEALPPGEVTLIDPMTGGATFLLEAALLDATVTARPYAFERFATVSKAAQVRPTRLHTFKELIGYESDSKTVQAAQDNLKRLKFSPEPKILAQDFFKAEALTEPARRWIVANPPYGERIKVEGDLKAFYENLFVQCERVAKPELAAFLLPEKAQPERLKRPKGWRIAESRRLSNGGLPIIAVVFAAPAR